MIRALETVFLDAGGVLIFPNWERISATLARHGVDVTRRSTGGGGAACQARTSTRRRTVSATNDEKRGWLYFNLILEQAGITPRGDCRGARGAARLPPAINLWEYMPDDVLPSLRALARAGPAAGRRLERERHAAHACDRLGLTECVDCVLDSFIERVEKPDPRFFEIALERSGADRDDDHPRRRPLRSRRRRRPRRGHRAVLLDAADLYPDADCPRVEVVARACGAAAIAGDADNRRSGNHDKATPASA